MMFIASVEVEPLPGCKMAGGSVGAVVYCLIPAKSRSEAARRLRAALKEDKYRLVKIESLDNYDFFKWQTKKDQMEYDTLAEKAGLNDDVVYGPFYAWKTR